MRPPIVTGDAASCGHPAVSTSNVFIQGRNACIITVSTAGGPILGPGSPKVLVNGLPISVLGDAVTPHGSDAHSGPAMATAATTKVFVP
jgi:uncharacterized Zn-binding protein involved in type VI secretion